MKNKNKANKKYKNKDVVYLGSVCKVSENGDRISGIFLTDVYLVKYGDKYLNYYNQNEVYSTTYEKVDDVFVNIVDVFRMDERDVFKHMLYNPQYCKDRAFQIKKMFEQDNFSIINGDYEKCQQVINLDSMCHERYSSYNPRYKVKKKIK